MFEMFKNKSKKVYLVDNEVIEVEELGDNDAEGAETVTLTKDEYEELTNKKGVADNTEVMDAIQELRDEIAKLKAGDTEEEDLAEGKSEIGDEDEEETKLGDNFVGVKKPEQKESQADINNAWLERYKR